MAAVLGKVFEEPSQERGPDVAMTVSVPVQWLATGAELRVTLPRRLPCARCDGGGCDRCGRRGAVTLREPGQDAEWVDVSLGSDRAGQAVTLRIPERGGPAEPGQVRGLLLLTLRPAAEPDASVQLHAPPPVTVAWLPWLLLPPVLLLLYWWLAP